LLSPYAATKLIDEIYADTFGRTHGIDCVGLRYFNVFGPRQDPQGAYAAVIPRWTEQLITGQACTVFGDGSASRDFCYVDNVVQANLLAAFAPPAALRDRVFNVACGSSTRLTDLYALIRGLVAERHPEISEAMLRLDRPRPGDIQYSLASIVRAQQELGYAPLFDVASGMKRTVDWYLERASGASHVSELDMAREPAREAS
jgi:UDP-N-acetylglucosamine 4-epimerase